MTCRIAYCCSAPHGGGTLNHLVDLLERHDRDRFEPLAFLDRELRDAEAALRRLEAAGIPVVRRPTQRLRPYRGDLGRWRRSLRAHGPFDVAALHQHVPGSGGAFLSAARREGIEVRVVTEQLARFPPLDDPGWWRRRLTRRHTDRLRTHTVAVSDAGRRVLTERGIPSTSITVIPTAFRECAFDSMPDRTAARGALALPRAAPVAGFAASLSIQKRPDVFLSAVERCLDAVPDAVFLVAGDGPLAGPTRARCVSLGDRVRFLDPVDDVPAFLAALDVFVLSSDFEGLPITLLEALRAGTAVVAASVDGVPEVVRDDESGLLVPAGDPAALGAAMIRLLEDPTLRARLARAGRARVVDLYEAAHVTRRLEALYARLLASR